MNILTFTSLWPNAEQPNFGIFVQHRVAAISKLDGVNMRVVAPVPYFPRSISRSLPRAVLNRIPAHWRLMAKLPEQEVIAGLETFHPRYLVTPKVGMRFYGDWMARGAWQTVLRLHREQPIDLIDAHYAYPDGCAATLLGRRLNVPVFITTRGTDINLFSRMPLIRPRIVKALNQAAGVIAVSHALKRRMIELGVAAEKIAVIPNGVDREVFHPRHRDEMRRKLGLNPEDRILLTVAALVPVKGVERLIQAIGSVIKHNQPRIKLFVLGEGPERTALESRISNLKLQDHIFLLGAKPQSELADWYSAADLFCLASYDEGCPNVVLEALACGLPVVASDVGGIRQLLDQQCGRVVVEPAAENLASEIRAALSMKWSPEKIARLHGTRSWTEVAQEVSQFFARQCGY